MLGQLARPTLRRSSQVFAVVPWTIEQDGQQNPDSVGRKSAGPDWEVRARTWRTGTHSERSLDHAWTKRSTIRKII